jgi:Tfp pilus assembly protein PilX
MNAQSSTPSVRKSPGGAPGFRIGRQGGFAVLILSLVILTGLTIVTFFAAQSGLTTQRISANEVRAKAARENAEGGIERTIAWLRDNLPDLDEAAGTGWVGDRWVACADADTAEPCGDGAGNNLFGAGWVRYELASGTTTVEPSDADFEARVAARCVDDVAPEDVCDDLDAATGGVQPGPSLKEDAVFAIFSRGRSDDQSGEAVVQQGVSIYKILGVTPDSPLIAASTGNITGSFELVANPDGGGPGVPLSVWSNNNVDVAGSAAMYTCQLDEYLATGVPIPDAQEPEVEECDTASVGAADSCACSKILTSEKVHTGLMSYKDAATTFEAIDILDEDNQSAAQPSVIDDNPDSTYFPSDLFKYVFRVSRDEWDTVYENATWRFPIDGGNCQNTLDANSAGLYWQKDADCKINANQIVGSPRSPVLLVVQDGDFDMGGGAVFYGIIFLFDSDGSGDEFDMAGGAYVYGAVIVDGVLNNPSGSATLRYEKKVLENLAKDPGLNRPGKILGTALDYIRTY